jgi:hypothetical protein
MEQLLFLDGTAWEAAAPPLGPRPAALDMLHAVAGVGAELAATAPALLAEVLEELLLGTLDGFAQVWVWGGQGFVLPEVGGGQGRAGGVVGVCAVARACRPVLWGAMPPAFSASKALASCGRVLRCPAAGGP